MKNRKLEILKAIIDDYILSAEPVGSRTIARRHELGLSPATIRNEMADLEDLGFLTQPHTSSGRIPSDKAYRLYVDRLMKVKSLSMEEADFAKSIYREKSRVIEEIIKKVTKVISDITNYTSIAIGPQLSKVKVHHIQLVPVSRDCALVVAVTDSGIIKDTIIKIPEGMDEYYLNTISARLNALYKDRTIYDIDSNHVDEVKREMSRDRRFFDNLVDAINAGLNNQENNDLYLGGTTKIFNFPEYQDLIKAKSFLSLMEQKDLLYRMMAAKESTDGIQVVIGSENEYDQMQDYSVVTATYRIGKQVMGTIGIIGPTRLEYAKTVSTLDFMGKNLSKHLTRIFNEED